MEREDKHFISGYLLTDQSSGQLRDSHRDTSLLLRHKYMTQGKIHDGDSADTVIILDTGGILPHHRRGDTLEGLQCHACWMWR